MNTAIQKDKASNNGKESSGFFKEKNRYVTLPKAAMGFPTNSVFK